MEIIHPEYVKYVYEVNKLRLKLAELITYRDSLEYHITRSLSIDYMLKIGNLEYKLLQIQNSISKNERIIELIKVKNISFKEAVLIVKKEFLEQDCKIALMGEAVDRAISDSQRKILSKEELEELNLYYKPLVRDFSPEINISISDEQKLLFENIKEKYISGNISQMKKFKVFEKSELYFDELEVYKKEKKRLIKLAQVINSENDYMKNMYPYAERTELLDENLLRRKKDSINKEIILKQEILNKLEEEVKNLNK